MGVVVGALALAIASPAAEAIGPVSYQPYRPLGPLLYAISGDLSRLTEGSQVIDVASGQVVALPADQTGIALDRTGAHVLTATPGGAPWYSPGLRVRTVATGAERTIAPPSNTFDLIDLFGRDVAMSPSGDLVVFATSNGATLRRSMWAVRGTAEAVDITAGLPATALNRAASEPSISADGRYVVFVWGNFYLGCTEPGPDCLYQIVRYDTFTGQHTVVSVTSTGAETAGMDRQPAISGDGRYVAWLTDAMGVVPGPTTRRMRLYLRDIVAGTTRLLAEGGDDPTGGPVHISDDGRRVAATLGRPLAGDPVGATAQLVDLTDGTVTPLGRSGTNPLDGYASVDALSPDGSAAVILWLGRHVPPAPCCELLRAIAPRLPGPPGPLVYPVIPPGPPIPRGHPLPLAFVPPTAVDGFITAITPDGRYIGVNDGDTIPTGVARIDVRTGATVHIRTIGPARLSGDGRYMATADCRWDLASGAVERVNPSCSEVPGAISGDGSVIFGPPVTAPIFAAPTLWRPGSTPVVFPVLAPGYDQVVRSWMSTDGRRLTVWRTSTTCTTACVQLVRFDLGSGNAAVVPLPSDAASPEVSADGTFVAFISEAAGVVPGLGAGRRAYRLHVPSGEVVAVTDGPVQVAVVSDDGAVAFLTTGPVTEAGALRDGPRVGFWRDGRAALIDWGHDGLPPDFPRGGVGVGGAAFSGILIAGDGRTVLWATGARNVTAGRTAGGLVVADVAQWTPPPTPPPTPTPAPPVAGAGATSVVPERLLDTRPGSPVGYVGDKPGAGATVELTVTGAGSAAVPTDARAVLLNVTATEATADGYVTVWPCGTDRPTASNLNVVVGRTAPNLVAVKLGTGGRVCLYTQSGVHLIADLAAWYPAGSAFVPVAPERLLDTRTGAGGRPGAGEVVTLDVTGVGASAVPADAAAVVLNVTGTEAADDGYVTVWPCGTDRPTASNLNLVRDGTRPNLVAVKVGTDGDVCLFTQSGTHLVADISGWFPADSPFEPVVPERLLDTRTGAGYSGPKPRAGDVVELQVTGSGATSVPADATTAVLNVTATEATADGYVTVWPCGAPRPTASNLNLITGETAANLVSVKLGTGGRVCLFTQSGGHLLADITGYER